MERVKRARVEAGGKPLLPEEPKGRQTGTAVCSAIDGSSHISCV